MACMSEVVSQIVYVCFPDPSKQRTELLVVILWDSPSHIYFLAGWTLLNMLFPFVLMSIMSIFTRMNISLLTTSCFPEKICFFYSHLCQYFRSSGCILLFDEYQSLPYVDSFTQGTVLPQLLSPYVSNYSIFLVLSQFSSLVWSLL